MPITLNPPAPPRPANRLAVVLISAAALLAALLVLHGPVLQWADYHAFADRRSWLGLPNAADVLSNLPFALVGAWGLWRLRGVEAAATTAWRAFCAALIATAAGSTLYHLAPDNTALVFDRLPIAWACASLLCAFLAERWQPRAARPAVLVAALLAASASVGQWWWGDRLGAGDLRAYLFVQFLPMLLVPLTLVLRRGDDPPGTVPASAWWTVLACYAAAKGMELADRAVFDTLGVLSGHTLKHLLAAAGATALVARISCGSPR